MEYYILKRDMNTSSEIRAITWEVVYLTETSLSHTFYGFCQSLSLTPFFRPSFYACLCCIYLIFSACFDFFCFFLSNFFSSFVFPPFSQFIVSLCSCCCAPVLSLSLPLSLSLSLSPFFFSPRTFVLLVTPTLRSLCFDSHNTHCFQGRGCWNHRRLCRPSSSKLGKVFHSRGLQRALAPNQ